jgi:hypothetical protein
MHPVILYFQDAGAVISAHAAAAYARRTGVAHTSAFRSHGMIASTPTIAAAYQTA